MAELPKDMIYHYESKDGLSVTVTMTELVRCKDCKFFNPHIRECEGIGKWFGLEGEWDENDFCSKGEKEK